MTMEQKMPISDLQFAFFFANPPINLKFDEFSVDLRRKPIFTKNGLDLQTFIFPVPNDVPAEIPRCQITSNNNIFSLTISGNRCDINLRITDIFSSEIFNQIILSIMDIFQENKLEIIRLGYITRYIIKNNNPDKIIREKFLKIEEDNVLEPFVRFIFKESISSIIYNDVYQIEVAKQRDFTNGIEENILLITQDFNTLPESTNTISLEDLRLFISKIPKSRAQSYIKKLSS